MTWRRMPAAMVIRVAALASTASMSPGEPPVGQSGLSNVPHIPQQTTYYCVPAAVLMWRNYVRNLGPNSDFSQTQVWNYMKAGYPSETIEGVGAGARATEFAARNYIASNVTLQTYHDNSPGDLDLALRQMCADQRAGLDSRSTDQAATSATRNGLFIPHPYATTPAEIMANVVAAVRHAHVDEAAEMPELAMRNNELRLKRILDVTSLERRKDYYVVELVNPANTLMANVAIEKSGLLIGVAHVRGKELPRSVDLGTATDKARTFTKSGVSRTRYVYMISAAELGSPVFAPLAAVETLDGTVYVNSKGEAFSDENSPVTKARGVAADLPQHPAFRKLRRLKH